MPELPQFDAPFTPGAQLDARANDPAIASRTAVRDADRSWTYRQFRDEAVRFAHFLLRRLGPVDYARPGRVAMFLENPPSSWPSTGGGGYAGLMLFGVNTGLRGKTLASPLIRVGGVRNARFRNSRLRNCTCDLGHKNLRDLPMYAIPGPWSASCRSVESARPLP